MSPHRPGRDEELVIRTVIEALKEAEKANDPWPELDEPSFSRVPRHPSLVERVSLWTMASVLGAVTISAIATGDREVLLALVAVAGGTLIRLIRRLPEVPMSEKRTYDPRKKRPRKGSGSKRQGEDPDDS